MAYRTVLVHAAPDRDADCAVALATTVAEMFKASVVGVGAEAFEPAAYGYMAGELLAAACDQIDVDLTAAEARFRQLTAGCPAGTDWISERGYPLDVMVRHARGADLVVAHRPKHHPGADSVCMPVDLLMKTGLPILLPSELGGDLSAKHVVVAWDHRREANRAVSDALPFLMRADAVHIVHVGAAGDTDALEGLAEVKRRLMRHGVSAQTEIVAPAYRSYCGDLEAAANRHGADLIVCGGYGHSRMREWVMGGVTQEFLEFSKTFILLSR